MYKQSVGGSKKESDQGYATIENYVIPIRGGEDMGNLNSGAIDSVL